MTDWFISDVVPHHNKLTLSGKKELPQPVESKSYHKDALTAIYDLLKKAGEKPEEVSFIF